jgi:glycosyltransferase involved in cell wall biosynthesis
VNERRPRILIVIAQLDIGGAERQVVNLVTGLAQRGFDVSVAVFYPNGELEGQLRSSGVVVHHLKRTTKHGLETILSLRRLLRRHPVDVVHSFLWPANWRARAAAIWARVPIVISSSRSVETWLRLPHVVLDRILARGTDAIVVNAAAIRDYLVQREGVPRELFHVIPNGIDLEAFEGPPSIRAARASLKLPPSAHVILTVGNLQPEKNHEDFLALAATIRRDHPEAVFVVVGDGPRRSFLAQRAEELGLEGCVRWEGRTSDVVPYFAACDVFINTSQREGCCNAILEAMAMARPVVAYDVGGNPELVQDGQTGRIVSFGRVDDLSRAVAIYLDQPDLARAHGEVGAQRVRRDFSRDAMVNRTIALYGDLMSREEPRASDS